MAVSNSHKFGQIVGDVLESAIEIELKKFAKKNKLYLDKKGKRKARKGKKVSWVDINGNKHDLDFVIERGGTENKVGVPIAFIETAWRRYTKHSRNKAQEIQSAIRPLYEKHNASSPFIGVILAGEFTQGALDQLKSLNFVVLHFSYDNVVKVFSKYGIDASSEENTTENQFQVKIKAWRKLSDKNAVAKELLKIHKSDMASFISKLSDSISRYVVKIHIVPLFGSEKVINTVKDAISFIEKYTEGDQNTSFVRYEIQIRYNTGDRIEGAFIKKNDAVEFLRRFL
jgi:hypothetical protein